MSASAMREVVEAFDPIRESMQRDQFAGQAMAAMLRAPVEQLKGNTVKGETMGQFVARNAWDMADLMMAERARRASPKGGDE